MPAGWIEQKLADCGLGYDAAAADTAGVADPAVGDSGVLMRAVARSFWCFFAAFLVSFILFSTEVILKALS